jgi:hypothetical protein
MTIYGDLTETTDYSDFSDPTEDLASVTDGCCGSDTGDVDASTGGWTEDVIVDDSWAADEFASATYEPAAPVDASMVIPAGQPGGYEVPTVATVATVGGELDWHATGTDVEHLYPSVGTIGGDQLGAMTITPGADAAPTFLHELGTIGHGEPYGTITITTGDGGPNVSPSSSPIGPSHASTVNVLGALRGKGDILSEVLMSKSIDRIQASAAP